MVYNILACVLRPSVQPSSKTFNFQETAKLSSLVVLSLKMCIGLIPSNLTGKIYVCMLLHVRLIQ